MEVWNKRWFAGRAVSDLIWLGPDHPADLLRLFVCRCPGKGKKVWEAHPASFVPHLPSGKGAGDEPIVLRSSYTTLKLVPGIVTRISVQDFDAKF